MPRPACQSLSKLGASDLSQVDSMPIVQHLLLVLGLQDLGTLLAQLGAVAVQGQCTALLGVPHVQAGSGHSSHTGVVLSVLLSCLQLCTFHKDLDWCMIFKT